MAKIVSEKREIIAPARTRAGDIEPRSSTAVTLLGIVLTVLFLGGAVWMVVAAFAAAK